MRLKLSDVVESSHLSHFMDLVSAYANNPENQARLAQALRDAQLEAKRESKSAVVDQDTIDFFFLVHPSGTISLCCRMRTYTIEEEAEELL